jgi:hypothetical protein
MGIIIMWNDYNKLIKDGVRRFVNNHKSSASPRLRGDTSRQ